MDEHMQDQLLIFAALAAGKSTMRVGEVTMHTKTAVYILELLCDVSTVVVKHKPLFEKCCINLLQAKCAITEQDDGTSLIEIDGIGFGC
jgi:hypothetical protein